MAEFSYGNKVIVKSFEATVVGYDNSNGTWHVRDDAGFHSYIYVEHLEKVLPYKDGHFYLAADGEVLIFRVFTSDDNSIQWETADDNLHADDYAVRPLREIGPEIEE